LAEIDRNATQKECKFGALGAHSFDRSLGVNIVALFFILESHVEKFVNWTVKGRKDRYSACLSLAFAFDRVTPSSSVPHKVPAA